jgi:hypothetical protein
MIDDMALLKQEMEQMDAEDPVAAQAAKDRAAQTLSNAKLSFSKMAELIEQRQLLLRPRILTNLKRMDQPGMLGDAAFRDAGSALRREGQSFRQIAEALELNTRPAPRYEDVAQESDPPRQMVGEPLYQMTDEQLDQMPREPLDQMAPEPRTSGWLRALFFVARIVFFPLRHPFRFLAIALVAMLLYYAGRGSVSLGQQVLGYFDVVATVRHSADNALSSMSSFFNEQILHRSKEAPAPTTTSAPIPPAASPPSPTPPAGPATASAPPATVPTPSATLAPPSAPPSAFPAGPPVSTPRREARGAPPSRSTANRDAAREDRYPSSRRYEDDRSGAFDDIIPPAVRRKSLTAGPCVGGVGGCYWGGFHY